MKIAITVTSVFEFDVPADQESALPYLLTELDGVEVALVAETVKRFLNLPDDTVAFDDPTDVQLEILPE